MGRAPVNPYCIVLFGVLSGYVICVYLIKTFKWEMYWDNFQSPNPMQSCVNPMS